MLYKQDEDLETNTKQHSYTYNNPWRQEMNQRQN